MQEWFEQFANPSFMPHGHCYAWRPDILWTHVISDVVIGLSYYVIPLILGVLLFKRKDTVPYKELFGLFMAFIFFCGTTHFVSIYVTWYAAYEYQGWLKALTAFTSLLTVIVLAPKLQELIKLPEAKENYLKTLKELEVLQEKHQQMSSVYTATLEREERIIELKKEVNDLMVELQRIPTYKV
ncbi:hypothetical protein [Paraglaciecola aestuariivivens]